MNRQDKIISILCGAIIILIAFIIIHTCDFSPKYLKPQVVVSYLHSNKPIWRISVTNDYQWWLDSNGMRMIQIDLIYGNWNGIKKLDGKE